MIVLVIVLVLLAMEVFCVVGGVSEREMMMIDGGSFDDRPLRMCACVCARICSCVRVMGRSGDVQCWAGLSYDYYRTVSSKGWTKKVACFHGTHLKDL